jgi:hypothetical protein
VYSAANAFKGREPDFILASPQRLDTFSELVELIHTAVLRIYEAAQAFPSDLDVSNVIDSFLLLTTCIFWVERSPDAESYILDLEDDEGHGADLRGDHSDIRVYAER